MTAQLVFSALVAFATVVYAVLTFMMWRQMRRTNERLDQPDVRVLLSPGQPHMIIFELTLKNGGNVPVYNVRLDVEPKDIPYTSKTSLGEMRLFKETLPVLSQGQEITTALFNYLTLVSAGREEAELRFTVSYETAAGKRSTQVFGYRLGVYKDLSRMSQGSIGDVAKQAEKMATELSGMHADINRYEARLEWSNLLQSWKTCPSASVTDLLSTFAAVWTDLKALDVDALVDPNPYMLRVLCEELHRRLSASEYAHQEPYVELRRKFLKLARMELIMDGGKSAKQFTDFADEITASIPGLSKALRTPEPPMAPPAGRT